MRLDSNDKRILPIDRTHKASSDNAVYLYTTQAFPPFIIISITFTKSTVRLFEAYSCSRF